MYVSFFINIFLIHAQFFRNTTTAKKKKGLLYSFQ